MGKTRLPPQFEKFLLDFKADTWHNLVMQDIPALQTQLQAAQTQLQAAQTQVTALQAQNQALQAQIQAPGPQIQAPGPQIQVIQVDESDDESESDESSVPATPLADAVYGPASQVPDNIPEREEMTIDIADAHQGQYLMMMESLVSGMADTIRNRVVDSLPGRLKAWLQVADGRKKLAIRAPAA
jgi:capsule polysaccharide export protein KpsE/RkpR